MKRELFRREVGEHAQQAWLGRIVLIRPLSFSVLVLAAGLVALAILAYLAFGEYTKKARVTGMLVPDTGLVKVFVQQPGVVIERFAREGDRIGKGMPLFIIGDMRRSAEQASLATGVARQYAVRTQALASQSRLAEEMARAEQGAIAARGASLRHEARRVDEEIVALRQRVELAQRALERMRSLQQQGFLSTAQTEQRQEDLLDQQLRLKSLLRTRGNVDRELELLATERALTEARSRNLLAGLAGQRAALEQEKLERDATYRSTIVAPESGTIASHLAEPGQTVLPGVPVLSIVPEHSRLEAHLFATSRAVGFVRTGQSVLIRYSSYPFQKFGAQKARVAAISSTALSPAELGFAPADGSREPVYRIKAALESQTIAAYGRRELLQPGMQVEADVKIERRRLIEWVFEPLLSLAGRA